MAMTTRNRRLLCHLWLVAALSALSGCLSNFDSDSSSDSGNEDAWLAEEAGGQDASTAADPQCGNDIAEALEVCDGLDLRDQSCSSLGHAGGELRCAADCSLDVSGCEGEPECTGSCTVCVSFGEGACEAQVGCTWVAAACSGSPNACAGSNPNDCVYGCDLDPAGPCEGGQHDCGNITKQSSCVSAGCVYENGLCLPAQTFNCVDIGTALGCNDFTSGVCHWDTIGPCSGTANTCIGRQEQYCELGCVWQPGTCVGTCQPCTLFDNQSGCEDQTGCTWEPKAVR